jgi:hypothetical protein
MYKWDLAENDKCECEEVQDKRHVYECPNLNTQRRYRTNE